MVTGHLFKSSTSSSSMHSGEHFHTTIKTHLLNLHADSQAGLQGKTEVRSSLERVVWRGWGGLEGITHSVVWELQDVLHK